MNHIPYIKAALFVLMSLSFSLTKLLAQQLPQFTSISINPYLINPALAGTEDYLHFQAGYRSQWTGFEDAPQTAYFSGHTTLSKRVIGSKVPSLVNASRTSLGIQLLHDETGPLRQSNAALSFAYNFALSNTNWRLSIGLNGGFQSHSYNPDGFSENLLHQEDAPLLSYRNNNLLSFASGMWLYNDHFFVGASSFQMFHVDKTALGDDMTLLPSTSFLRHYYYMIGAKANLGLDLYLVPALLIKTVKGAPISYDLNAKLVISDKYWLGGSYRREDSFAVFGGTLIKQRVEVTYSFDLVTSKIRNATAGSSEIHLGYRLFHHPEVACPSRFW